MAHHAIAENDGFHEGCPAEVVDVIQRRAALDQRLNDLMVAQVRCRDQRRAVVDRGDRLGIRAQHDREADERRIVADSGDCDDIVTSLIKQSQIRASRCECAQRRLITTMGGNMGRRPPMFVAHIDIGRRRRPHQGLDGRHVTCGGGRVKSGIRRYLSSARRCLG